MSKDRHCPRIDTVEIKFQIERALGSKKSEHYFDILNRYLSLKLSKREFDKLCIGLVGRENICLHNRLIRAIVKNACVARTPPPNHSREEAGRSEKLPDGLQRSCLQSLCRDGLAQSQRKGRTPVLRDLKLRDCPSPLGPHGKRHVISCDDSGSKSRQQPSVTEVQSLGSRPPVEVNSVEEGEEVEQAAGSPGIYSRSPVRAPLGIPLNAKGTKKLLLHGASPIPYTETCQKTSMLPDTSSLTKRLEQKLGMEGLNASTNCINLVNNGLDVYIKRLINSCLEIASSKSGERRLHQMHPRMLVLNGMQPMGYSLKPNESYSVSMLDFGVAMEWNPRILGEDWPVQLEKISLLASEEYFMSG
ncbi:hypothetical protein LIER_06820 [Lithospermum erythrorhizon]|uniref:Uncharacterized protein n=1 Tax=Lithospermum erythrorhizon TaxID=34254 RepID=A0AAV3P5Z4_LITER